MKISIVGAGYVGLVTGACLAEMGHAVTCVDRDESRIRQIQTGETPIYEPGLSDLIHKNVGRSLFVTAALAEAVCDSEITIIAVGTPFDGERIDLSQVAEAATEIGTAIRTKAAYHVVAVKSTVVPGTTEGLVADALQTASGLTAGRNFGLCVNPEFLREGEAVTDFMDPDRIVLGATDERSFEAMERLYSMFGQTEKIRTTPRTAEMIKYSANCLLATLISFSNEIANLCARLGDIDAMDVMRGVHLDRRMRARATDGWGPPVQLANFLLPGCGFGGSCFPKDLKALLAQGVTSGESMELLQAVVKVNERQPQRLVSLIQEQYSSLKDVRVTVLGLAFKAGTDDIRESPAIPVIHRLIRDGARVKAYDPRSGNVVRPLFRDDQLEICNDLGSSLVDAEVVVLITPWPEFGDLAETLNRLGTQPLIVDGRRLLDKTKFHNYKGIGL